MWERSLGITQAVFFYHENLCLVFLHHLRMNSLSGLGCTLGDGTPHHQLAQHLSPIILALFDSLKCYPSRPYLREFQCMLTPWHMTSFVIIITLFGCLGNVFSKYHFNRIVSPLVGIVLVSQLNPLNLDRRWENNFFRLNLILKIDNWGGSFQFKFQTCVQLLNFRKFPKITFFLHNF